MSGKGEKGKKREKGDKRGRKEEKSDQAGAGVSKMCRPTVELFGKEQKPLLVLMGLWNGLDLLKRLSGIMNINRWTTPKLKKLTNMQVKEGQKLTLRCELLAGGRQTKIQWYQNGNKIVKNDTRKIKLKKKGALSELQLTKVTDSDVGTYTCTAVNERGEDSQNAIVQVIKGKKRDLLVINIA
ncbi:hypothetical protein Q7C36_020165 [Tachysurus vachellii]|uniref:Ig-like domain-containing protein n=1 Tax=Tachysurus vachellii TaxID=175792 RepID=A0AA88LT53_TACVA|nr:hypothetical protein Q7C36_020165 [Tachysurus vachellii]